MDLFHFGCIVLTGAGIKHSANYLFHTCTLVNDVISNTTLAVLLARKEAFIERPNLVKFG